MGSGRAAALAAEALAKSLSPEAGIQLPGSRVAVRRGRDAGTVELVIEAQNLRALRAAVNSQVRWASLSVEVANAARK